MWIMRQCGLLIHIVVIHIFRVHIVVSPKKKGKKKSENMPVIYDRSYMTGIGWVGRVG